METLNRNQYNVENVKTATSHKTVITERNQNNNYIRNVVTHPSVGNMWHVRFLFT